MSADKTTAITTRRRKKPAALPEQDKPSERVFRRLVALCAAEGVPVLPISRWLPSDVWCACYPEEESARERALSVASDLGLHLARGEKALNDLAFEDMGDLRSDRFTADLLANLYAAEALTLPLD